MELLQSYVAMQQHHDVKAIHARTCTVLIQGQACTKTFCTTSLDGYKRVVFFISITKYMHPKPRLANPNGNLLTPGKRLVGFIVQTEFTL